VLRESFKWDWPEQVQIGCSFKNDLSGNVVLGTDKDHMIDIFFIAGQTGTER
jgi:hypothetical protein